MTHTVDDRRIETVVRGRYLLQMPEQPSELLLVGFHGYGETAELQLDRLTSIPTDEAWILASVQALHPFYKGRSQDVGASWMTRSDRELAIEDNLRFVRAVLAEIRGAHRASAMVFAGFSQGVGMAFRAALASGFDTAGLIALGGDVPPELRLLEPSAWRGRRVLLGRGTRDEWYSQAKMDEDVAFLKTRAVALHTLVFEGGHAWTPDFSSEAALLLRAVSRERG